MEKQVDFGKRVKEIKRYFESEGIYITTKAILSFIIRGRDIDYKLNIGGGSYTDGKVLVVGVMEDFLFESYEIIYNLILTLLGHEAQHKLSTSFKDFGDYNNRVALNLRKATGVGVSFSKRFTHFMGNALEDGRIERILANKLPGFIPKLKFLNMYIWKLNEIDENDTEISALFNSILTISKLGILPKGFDKHFGGTELEAIMDDITPLIIKANKSITSKGCFNIAEEIIEKLYDFIKTKLEEEKEQEEMEKEWEDAMDELMPEEGYEGNSEEEFNKNQKKTVHLGEDKKPEKQKEKDNEKDDEGASGGADSSEGEEDDSRSSETSEGDSSESEQEDNDDNESESSNSKDNNSTDDDGDKGAADDSESEDDEDAGGGGADSSENEENDEGEGNSKSDKSDGDKDEEGSDGEEENATDSDEGDSAKSSDGENSSPDEDNSKSEKKSYNPYGSGVDNREKEIERRIEEEMEKLTESLTKEAEKAFEKSKEEEDKKKAEEYKSPISNQELDEVKKKNGGRLGFFEYDINFQLNLPLFPEVNVAARKFRKDIQTIFNNRQGLNLNGQNQGILNPSDLYKVGMGNYNVFTIEGHKSSSNYVAYVLRDGSGSMNGLKDYESMKALAIIEEGLRDAIPFKLVSFSQGYSRVEHNVIRNFNHTNSKSYSTNYYARNKADNCNDDGYSIGIASKELMNRPEPDKLLIVLSDGLPSSQETTKAAIKDARRLGINVIGICFGDENFRIRSFNSYKDMYEKNIISVSPEGIPKALTELLKKILVR